MAERFSISRPVTCQPKSRDLLPVPEYFERLRYRRVSSADDIIFGEYRHRISGGMPRPSNARLEFDRCPAESHIKPAARRLGLGFVNWRCLRTSHATWLKMAGADVKDAQAQLRHSRASKTLDVYQQFVPESQRRAVDRLTDLEPTALVQ